MRGEEKGAVAKSTKKHGLSIIGGVVLALIGLVALVTLGLSAICISCAEWLNLVPPSASSQNKIAVPQDAPVGINPGQLSPDFTLTDIDGNDINLRDFTGRPTVIYFSASWCSPCIHETEALARYKDRYPDLNIIWISVDPLGDSANSLRDYRQKYARESFIYALDRPTNEIAKQYQINALGTLFLLNRNQVITFKGVQPVGTANFDQALKLVLP